MFTCYVKTGRLLSSHNKHIPLSLFRNKFYSTATPTTPRKSKLTKTLVMLGGLTAALTFSNIVYYEYIKMNNRTLSHYNEKQKQLIEKIEAIVGTDYANLKINSGQEPFTKGMRIGCGRALAVVKPGSFREAIDILKLCLANNVAIISQGRNSGLTGGSVPRNEAGRDFVIISFQRLHQIIPILNENQEPEHVLCFAGAGLNDLAGVLQSYGKEPHSVLGSIFLNPSIAGGVAFGSGGTQLRKGPVYTERTLYAKVNEQGEVVIINNLGFKNSDNLFGKLEKAEKFSENDFNSNLKAHDSTYREQVCNMNHDNSRYNADVRGNSECVRSEGKVMILATIHDTFPKPRQKAVYWVSCSSFKQACELKKKVVLGAPTNLPSSCEYMNRDTFDVTDGAGRMIQTVIHSLGMRPLGILWDIKTQIEALPFVPAHFPDYFMYFSNRLMPQSLPSQCYEMGKKFDHNVIIEMGDYGANELARNEQRLSEFIEQQKTENEPIEVYKCVDDKEIQKVMMFRFAVAAAFTTYCVGKGFYGLSLDYSMPKNDFNIPHLPFNKANYFPEPVTRLRYMHFGCNVVHEDLAFLKSFERDGKQENTQILNIKHMIKETLATIGIKLPAEHGHGTEYEAPQETKDRWRRLDPLNVMNPGVGHTSTSLKYE